MEGSVQLLASIIALLTPLPYFRPILMTVADRVLDSGEMYSNSVRNLQRDLKSLLLTVILSLDLQLCRLVLSSKRDHSQIGMSLITALAYIDPSSITSSSSAGGILKSGRHGDGSNHVSRLTLNVWTTLADGGGLKVLPKLLSMRRKGGFAVDADPLDRPGESPHLELSFVLIADS
jgi:nucleolar pre-ribosomal-associated protein 1